MIKIKQAVIVEGKYDKIRLANIIDAVIIETNGFQIYKNSETAELIRYLARTCGIIILTDSDSAGFQIRSRIRSIVKDGEVINVYIPDIKGKEKRKAAPSKQGLLGVEGVSDEILLNAFQKAGVFAKIGSESNKSNDSITKSDLLDLGLVGSNNSASLRRQLQKKIGLPTRLSANMLLEIINKMYSKEEFILIVDEVNNLADNLK